MRRSGFGQPFYRRTNAASVNASGVSYQGSGSLLPFAVLVTEPPAYS